ADVAGHGNEVSGLAIELRRLMRRSINRPDQTRIARGLNRAFGRLSTQAGFATAAILTYFAPTDQLLCCLAGHPRPLWYRAESRRWGFLEPSDSDSREFQGFPLGIIHPTEYRQFAVTLGRGDLIVAYTDSLIEAHAPGADLRGEAGLLALAETTYSGAPGQLGRELIAAVDSASSDTAETRDDDLTLLVLHHNAADPPPVSLGHRLRTMAKMLGL
ncbi:MAG: serine/threonine-protein phosphatase, partial [Planctomycetes bacterium]|nr:serine/threonine-protein phosphatase [Planctomycetota bacterium]